ncbi:hypothetical protein BRC90_07415 [Halobacteriales archaeon QS_4_69_34]|nr:MAG: hypothetical protein BRC90_07415 [Halobacteriales archaeon QS_4_69_34]
MSDSDRETKHARNRAARLRQIREWAAYVESHPDEDWGEQVNALVDAQLQSARCFEDERPEPETLRESPLLDE